MARSARTRWPGLATTSLVVATGAAVWWMRSGRRPGPGRRSVSSGSKGRQPGASSQSGSSATPSSSPPPTDLEHGPAPFLPTRTGPQWDRLRWLAAKAEEISEIRGLYSYLLATAKNESDGVPAAMNTRTDAKPALRLFCRDQNYRGRYARNPWRPQECDASDPLASRWAYSGGWFQIMPAGALATSDKRGHAHDPARVFDPPFAIAYATDLVRRIKRGFGARTWGDIRAGWALPRWANPDSTAEGKGRVLERFERRLAQVASMGADPELAIKAVDTRRYPGFTTVLHALLEADGRPVPLH
ncbi:MAG: hypothetical protein AAF799_45865 [Myxococcota bacterium]